MKQKAKIGILCILVITCLGALFVQWCNMSVYGRRIGVYTKQEFSVGQVMDYKEKNPDMDQKITAWNRKTEKNIQNAKRTQTEQTEFYSIYGAMNIVFPCRMLYGNYPYETDTKGCLISSGLAQKLYGAVNIIGQTIVCKNRKWSVRGVIKEEKSFLAVTTGKREATMTYLEVVGEKKTPTHFIQQITAQIGITDISYQFDGSLVYAAARLLFGLPFFFLLWQFRANTNRKKIIWWALFFVWLMCFIRIPDSLIPSKWSDFDFWSRRAQEMRQGWEQWRCSPSVYWEAQVIQKMIQMLVSAGLVCGLVLYKRTETET